jgi:hypothetical protein
MPSSKKEARNVTELAHHSSGTLKPKPTHAETGLDFAPDWVELDVDLSQIMDDETLVMPGVNREFPAARVASILWLGVVAFALCYVARAGYYLATDVQVAPFMLTPDSDAITNSRLSLAALTTERETALTHREVLDQQLSFTRVSLERLQNLHGKVKGAISIAQELTTQSARSSQQQLQKLRGQKALIDGALAEQLSYIGEVDRHVESGLAHGADLMREHAELRRLRLLQLERDRDELSAENTVHALSLTMASQRGQSAKLTPEVLRLEEQLLRLELEIRRLEADEHGKLVERDATDAQRVRLDDLIKHLKQRPLYRAIAEKQTLAFVPYTQLHGVHAGSTLYECRIWSMFSCERVGRVAEVLPGEVESVDPWGAPARGQHAVIDLKRARAVTAKTLRVRSEDSTWSLFERAGTARR